MKPGSQLHALIGIEKTTSIDQLWKCKQNGVKINGHLISKCLRWQQKKRNQSKNN